jgi:hypothetical protein
LQFPFSYLLVDRTAERWARHGAKHGGSRRRPCSTRSNHFHTPFHLPKRFGSACQMMIR